MKTFTDLSSLAESAEIIERPTEPEPSDSRGNDLSVEKVTLDAIELDVLGELDKGAVKVFSKFHGKSDIIADVSRLTLHRLFQLCGPPARAKVHTGQDDIDGMYSMAAVKQAISIVAGFTRITEGLEIGQGIWRGKNDDGEDSDDLILVGAGEAAVRNGKPELERVLAPKFAGRILDISNSDPWFDFEQISELYAEATPEWMAEAVEELEELIARWKWVNQFQAPKVATGLVLATWIQTLWDWRPQVVVVGKSGSGKSTFFKFLERLYGLLAILSSSSSAAGIQQAVKTTGEICLCDEFDSNREREKICDLLRMSGRGDKALKGTPGLKGKRLTLRHIVWLAGIEDGLKREPDVNRFINLSLVKPSEEGMGKLNLPSHRELTELGQRLLVVAMKIAFEAKDLASDLSGEKFPGIDYRIVESFSVPAACYSVVFPDAGPARGVLERMLAIVDREIEDDEQQLLEAILESGIIYDSKHSSVSAAISDRTSIKSLEAIEAAGVAVIEGENRFLFIRSKTVARRLLKGTEWEKRNLDQVLLRIPGAVRALNRMDGGQYRGVKIPFGQIEGLA